MTNQILREKRTHHDFSKHQLHISESEHCIVHDLKLKNTVLQRVTFINLKMVDTMLVTGDFQRWSFCRQFVPCKDGENEFIDAAFSSPPDAIDITSISAEYNIHHHVLAIFDAFEEVYSRLPK